jgi:predicted Zn-dependent protease
MPKAEATMRSVGMKRWFRRIAHAMLIAGAFAMSTAPAAAQSVLRDAETEQLFGDMMKPIIIAAGLSPNNVRVVLLYDKEVNAFVSGGQTVFVNSGLIEAATSANEVQGVVAHEIGHIVGGHVPLEDRGVKPAMGIMLLSLALGLAAMAAGSGDAGAAIMSAGQTAAMGKFLAFSRSQEASADAAAVRFLNAAGISGKGFVSFFKKMQDEEYRLGYHTADIDPFEQSHPMFADRIEAATGDLEKSPNWNKPLDPDLERRFKRIQAKLRGYIDEPKATLVRYPESDQSVYAHYARAYAYHKGGYPEQAATETAALIKIDPHDPYFLELQGQIMLEGGDPKGALAPLREATQLTNYSPLIATTFGHALISTEDRANLAEAEKVLRQAVARDDDNPFAWYQLGMAYTQDGDTARAALATAEQATLTGDIRTAAQSARMAVAGLKPGTPDYLRAQDLQLSADNDMAQMKKKQRGR